MKRKICFKNENNCRYCKIISGEIKRNGGIIFQNDYITVFLGSQHHRGHTIVVWNKHEENVLNMTDIVGNFYVDVAMLFWDETIFIAKAVQKALKPDKLNYALLGNWTPHLHWHIYPRYKTDEDWGNPPDYKRRLELSEKEMNEIANKIKEILNETI